LRDRFFFVAREQCFGLELHINVSGSGCSFVRRAKKRTASLKFQQQLHYELESLLPGMSAVHEEVCSFASWTCGAKHFLHPSTMLSRLIFAPAGVAAPAACTKECVHTVSAPLLTFLLRTLHTAKVSIANKPNAGPEN
jgi:hypothetical protein